MSSDDKKDIDLEKALQKLDQDAAKINEQKRLLELQKKPVARDPGIDRGELIKTQNTENNRKVLQEISFNSTFLVLLFLTVAMISYTLTKDERTTLIEHIITALLVFGMVASRR